MKDIDTILSKHPLKPKRPLRADFAQAVAQELQNRPKRFPWARFFRLSPPQLVSRAGLASLVGLVLMTGSVAAFALWPRPHVTTNMREELPSGNHIVGYDTQNCVYRALDGSPVKPDRRTVYYEVRQGSSLTDQQLQDSLRAVCEEDISNNAISAIVKRLPANLPGVQSTMTYTITNVAADSITVSPDTQYDTLQYTVKPSMTYTNFAKDLLVYNQDTEAAYGDLHAGDSIKMVVQDTSGKTSETAENYNALNHPEHITILAIVKVPALTADPNIFYKALGTDLVRVDPCDSSPTGFCRAYEFAP